MGRGEFSGRACLFLLFPPARSPLNWDTLLFNHKSSFVVFVLYECFPLLGPMHIQACSQAHCHNPSNPSEFINEEGSTQHPQVASRVSLPYRRKNGDSFVDSCSTNSICEEYVWQIWSQYLPPRSAVSANMVVRVQLKGSTRLKCSTRPFVCGWCAVVLTCDGIPAIFLHLPWALTGMPSPCH